MNGENEGVQNSSQATFSAASKAATRRVQEVCPVADCIEYWLYPCPKSVPINATDTLFPALLAQACKLASDYIWHVDSFCLTAKDLPVPHYYGRTVFGENQEDEWFIVWILTELTRQFTEIVVHVRDSDGNLLLIEAADVLPNWLGAKTAVNRTFLYRGRVHLIPPCLAPTIIEHVEQGVQLVRAHSQQTMADIELQDVIFSRIDGYPERAAKLQHHAVVTVPRSVAYLLHRIPRFVACATRAFLARELADLQICRVMPRLSPQQQPANTLCRTRVRFTRHLYAMLVAQKYLNDRRCPWPPDRLTEPEDTLGYKLTLGCELALAHYLDAATSKSSAVHSKSNGTANGNGSSTFDAFLQSLTDNGYFKDHQPGSEQHSTLRQSALQFYKTLSHTGNSRTGDSKGDSVVSSAALVLDNINRDPTPLDAFAADLQQRADQLVSDDSSWLNVTQMEVESELVRAACTSNGGLLEPIERLLQINGHHNDLDTAGGGSSTATAASGAGNKRKRTAETLNLDCDQIEDSMRRLLDLEKNSSAAAVSSDDRSDSEESYGELDINDLHEDLDEKGLKGMQLSLRSYMRQMDEQLKSTTMAESFVKKPTHLDPTKLRSNRSTASPGADSIDLEDDDFTPVDIDRNLVHNMLAAYRDEQQTGSAGLGPATTTMKAVAMANAETLDSDDDLDEPHV